MADWSAKTNHISGTRYVDLWLRPPPDPEKFGTSLTPEIVVRVWLGPDTAINDHSYIAEAARGLLEQAQRSDWHFPDTSPKSRVRPGARRPSSR